MSKKFLVIDIMVFFCTILLFLFFSMADQKSYANRIEHLGLSATTMKVLPGKNMTISELTEQVKASKISNIKLHLNAKGIVYVYESKSDSLIPIDEGRNLSDSDFQSKTSIAVVGKDKYKTLYKPIKQPYVKLNNDYISVVGQINNNKNDALNKKIIVSLSPNLTIPYSTSIQTGDLLVDDIPKNEINKFENLVGSKGISYPYGGILKINQFQPIGTDLTLILEVIAIGFLMGFAAYMYAKLVEGNYKSIIVTSDKTPRSLNIAILRTIINIVISIGLGSLIGTGLFYIMSISRIIKIIFIFFLLMIILIVFFLNINRTEKGKYETAS